jgi:hypothetical protein
MDANQGIQNIIDSLKKSELEALDSLPENKRKALLTAMFIEEECIRAGREHLGTEWVLDMMRHADGYQKYGRAF